MIHPNITGSKLLPAKMLLGLHNQTRILFSHVRPDVIRKVWLLNISIGWDPSVHRKPSSANFSDAMTKHYLYLHTLLCALVLTMLPLVQRCSFIEMAMATSIHPGLIPDFIISKAQHSFVVLTTDVGVSHHVRFSNPDSQNQSQTSKISFDSEILTFACVTSCWGVMLHIRRTFLQSLNVSRES